jgi:hypothetical protein
MHWETPADYWALNDSVEAQQEALRRLVRDPEEAERLSEIGMDFIRAYRTQERMDAEIDALLTSANFPPLLAHNHDTARVGSPALLTRSPLASPARSRCKRHLQLPDSL